LIFAPIIFAGSVCPKAIAGGAATAFPRVADFSSMWRALFLENRQCYFFTKAAMAAYTVVASNNTITPAIIICLGSPSSF
jgi:hypothetical protein